MKLTPLMENAAARKLLEVVPPTFRDEVSRTLRMIQFSSWLAGFDAGQRSEITKTFPPKSDPDFMSQVLNEGDGVYRP